MTIADLGDDRDITLWLRLVVWLYFNHTSLLKLSVYKPIKLCEPEWRGSDIR
jgi:hypothetical protein